MPPFRQATPADVPALHALDLLCFTAPFRFSLRDMRHYVRAPTSLTLITDDPAGQGIAAFLILELTPPTAYVITLDVHPAHRRRGLARHLLAAAESQALQEQVASVHLHVSAENSPALALYRALGYAVTATEPDFYAPTRDAFTLTKTLTSDSTP